MRASRSRSRGDIGVVVTLEHLGAALLLGIVGWLLGRAQASSRSQLEVERLRRDARQLEGACERHRVASEELRERLAEAQDTTAQLEHSLLELPEIAQRLSATRNLREIPGSALDLVEEIYVPAYCVFYRMNDGGLVAVAVRGQSPYPVGHRVKVREGVVGWSAIRQMAITGFEFESLELPHDPVYGSPPFSLCLPVVDGQRTLGVILVGPTERELPRGREIGRTIALITAVTIAHTQTLKQQEQLAKTDGLTGLLNRTHLLKQLGDMIGQPHANPRISLFLFDVDHFKHYNDANGHLAGDDLLRRLAALLKDNIREGELVGRYGGEEFLMVLPGVVGDDAYMAADRVRKLIEEHSFDHKQSQPLGDVTVSGGVATWPIHGATTEEVLHCADLALYEAKRAGRNRVRAYSRAACDPEADGPFGESH